MADHMKVELSPKKVFKKMFFVVAILLFMNLMGLLSKHLLGQDFLFGLVPLFDFNLNGLNSPKLASALLL